MSTTSTVNIPTFHPYSPRPGDLVKWNGGLDEDIPHYGVVISTAPLMCLCLATSITSHVFQQFNITREELTRLPTGTTITLTQG